MKVTQISLQQTYDNNCYCVCSENEAVLIDLGIVEEKDVLKIQQVIGERTLLGIVYTHNHYDHIRGHTYFSTIPQYMCEEDIPCMEEINATFGYTETYPTVKAISEKNFSLGTFSFLIHKTPGHTPGSICIEIEGHLFTGDVLFLGTYGRTDFPRGNKKDMKKSLTYLSTLSPQLIVHPGHGKETTIKKEKEWMEKIIPSS